MKQKELEHRRVWRIHQQQSEQDVFTYRPQVNDLSRQLAVVARLEDSMVSGMSSTQT